MRKKADNKNTFSERLDSLVGFFSPRLSLQRKLYRLALRQFASYKGADRSRLRDSWIPGRGSADSDLLFELPTLRERSRDLNRNDAHASGITSTIVTNVIGTGIRPQSRIDRDNLSLTEEEADLFQKKAERAWQKWVPFADAGERMDFYEIQQLVERQILENGEILIIPLMLDSPGRPYAQALEIIEADRLATPYDLMQNKNIRSGVEIGERGEPVAYYIRKSHPGDIYFNYRALDSSFYIRYPVRNESGRPNVLHLYWLKRPGQTRGEPFFAPILTYFKDLSDYMEAELVAARVAACFAAFVKKTDPINAAFGRADAVNAVNQKIEALEPGMIEYLAPGEEISQLSPTRPGGTFEPFVERILRAISAGLNLPYEVVAKDFSKSSYSSARAALLEARRFFRARQEWLSKRLCQPVYEMFLEEAYLSNEVTAENFYKNKSDLTRARWIAPGWGWVDPTKEVEASRSSVEGNLSTLADECASLGKDWEEVMEQKAREEKKRKELGLEDKPLVKKPSADKEKDAIEPIQEEAGVRG